MKTSIVLGGLFLVSGVAALAAYAVQSSSDAVPETIAKAPAIPTSTSASGTTLTLSVPGMHCEVACAPKVRKTLAAVPGVSGVETNVDDKTATIVVGDGFELETAVAKLEEAGYPATKK